LVKELLFWKDNWLGSGSLKSIFPRLFSLSVSKEAKISLSGAWVNNVWVWNLSWRRDLSAWELDLVSKLLGVVHLLSPSIEFEDKWVWKDGDSVEYSVNLVYGFKGFDRRGFFEFV